MTPEDVGASYYAFLQDRIRRAGLDPATFPVVIAEDDEMFVKGVLPGYPGRPGAAYFRFFESALRTHEVYASLAARLGGFERLRRVLDFGSGHGRLTRTLLSRMPARRIWACDIYPNAVAWQAETFGVNGLVSVTHPSKFALDERHDIVFAGSVFSHLRDELFRGWLERLYRLVAPTGLLAFTVHGTEFAPSGQTIEANGIGYATWSESDTLDPEIYGMSYVTEAYVQQAVHSACGARAAAGLRRFPRAVFESQDLYVVAGADIDLADLEIAASPLGSFRRLEGGSTIWNGWALDPHTAAQLIRAELFVDDVAAGDLPLSPGADDILSFFPGAPNPPRAWSVDLQDIATDATLRVELTSSSGLRGYAYARRPAPGREVDAERA